VSASANEPLFPPDAVIRRVDGERVLLLGGGRALLLQLAHPLVARGVAEHSDFRRDPFARLRRTLDASYRMVFGTRAEAERVADAVRAVHHTVRGDGYQADDPELLMWVHATLVDTALRVHARFLGGLPPAEAEAYYQQSAVVAELLGVPRAAQPADMAAFRRYVRAMVGTLRVSDDGRRLASDVLYPRVPWPLALPAEVGRQVTAGLLPGPLRRQFGLSWDPLRGVAFDTMSLAVRQVLPRVPGRLRRMRLLPA
jgi:uncharacterized protein (DUF2236 family)